MKLSPLQGQLLTLVYASGAQGISRTEVARLLWEDREGAPTRHRLSQLLYDVRRKLDPLLIEAMGDRLVGTSGVWCDVVEMRAGALAREFATVAELIRGEFASLLGPATASFEHWQDAAAATLRRELSEAAAAGWSAAEAAERWEDALAASEVLRALEPGDPDLLARGVELQMLLGRVHEAQHGLRQLGNLAPELKDDIDERIRLIQRRDQDPGQALPLFGRTTELAKLVSTLGGSSQKPAFALVIGEPGIGKTRLCQEVAWRCETRGAAVLKARCGPFERSIPLSALIEALSSSDVTPFVRRLQEPWRSVILALMPVHAESPEDVTPPPEISSGSVPRRLFEAFLRLFESIIEHRPALLFIDDVQWVDETTLAVIDFLSSRSSAGSLSVMLATRPEHLRPRDTPAAQFLLRRKAQGDVWIDLAELDPDASGELVAAVGGQRLDSATASIIEARAAGNPFLLVELTHHQLRSAAEPGVVQGTLPTSVEHLVLERVSRASSRLGALLKRLSISGPVSLEELPAVLEWPLSTTLEAVEEGVADHLLIESGGVVEVKHALIAEVVSGTLSPGVRAALHLSAAEHLRRSGKAHAGQLAVHFELAGRREEACEFALEAADRAEADGAIAEAIGFLEIAQRTASSTAVELRVLRHLAHLYYRHSNYSVSAILAEEAARRLREAGQGRESDLLDIERFGALSETGSVAQESCLRSIDAIIQRTQAARDYELMIRASEQKVRILQRLDHPDRVREVLNSVEELKDRGSSEARIRARGLLALNAYYGDVKTAMAAVEEAVSLASHGDDAGLQALSRTRWFIVAAAQGILNLPEHASRLRSWSDQAKRVGDIRLWHSILANAGAWYTDVGEFDRAMEALRRSQAVLAGSEAPWQNVAQAIHMGTLHLAMGDIAEAERHFHAGEKRAMGLASHFIEAGLGLCALASGRLREAKRRERNRPGHCSWHFDPTLVLLLRAGILRAEGDVKGAIKILSEGAVSIEGRMIPQWLQLQLAKLRLIRRIDPATASQGARIGAELSQSLYLSRRAQEFRALI